MNDTASDKRQPSRDDKLTRIPVRHIYFDDSMTFPDLGSGYSTLSNQKCYRESENQSRYCTCDWIPAWQMFEFTFFTGTKEEPKVRYVAAANVRSWQREDGPR